MYILGLDLGGTNITCVLCDERGNIVARKKCETLVYEGKQKVLKRISNLALDVIQESKVNKSKILGLGIGAPGLLDMKRGIVRISPNFPDWRNVPLKDVLEKELSLPVVVENDANAAAFGEFWDGACKGKNVHNMICFTLGTGVGGGIIINDKVYQGVDGTAGELGHITVEKNGVKCGCGNIGCLETVASATGIRRRTIEKIKNENKRTIIKKLVNNDLSAITSKIVYQAYKEGDKLAGEIINETAEYLGIVIAGLINALNPEMIVIGGGVAEMGNDLIEPIKKVVQQRALNIPYKRVKIVKAKLGENAGAIGSAGVAYQKFS